MKVTTYQVRWDWINTREEDPVRNAASSDLFVSLIVKHALYDAYAYVNALLSTEIQLGEMGIQIENLRIVECVETHIPA